MRLTLAEPKFLKDSISIISELVNEARFKINKNAIELVAMDPANVAMVIFKLLSSCFTEYDVKKDIDLAINLSHLKMILKRASQNDMITLEMGEDNRLNVQLRGTHTRTFSIPIIDMEEKEKKVPELNFAIKINAPSTILNSIIEDADIVSESVMFVGDSNKLVLNAEGDLSKAEIEIKSTDDVKITAESKNKVKAKYSIEYLKKMIGGSKIADDVVIQFNKDYPIKLDYKIIDRVQLAFILAPRVEND